MPHRARTGSRLGPAVPSPGYQSLHLPLQELPGAGQRAQPWGPMPAPPHTSSGTPGKFLALPELAASPETGDNETHTHIFIHSFVQRAEMQMTCQVWP